MRERIDSYSILYSSVMCDNMILCDSRMCSQCELVTRTTQGRTKDIMTVRALARHDVISATRDRVDESPREKEKKRNARGGNLQL